MVEEGELWEPRPVGPSVASSGARSFNNLHKRIRFRGDAASVLLERPLRSPLCLHLRRGQTGSNSMERCTATVRVGVGGVY